MLSGPRDSQSLGGGEIAGQGWYAPNISADLKQGVGGWSEQEIVDYLKVGVGRSHAIVAGPMAEVVDTSKRYLRDDDLHAIAVYLKSTPGRTSYIDAKPVDDPIGQVAYLENCGFCHQREGQGIAGVTLPLAGGAHDMVRTVLGGMPAHGQYAPMAGLAKAIPPGQIAAIVNYVRSSWGNAAPSDATPEMVADLTKTTATMLSGTSQCQPQEFPSLDKAIDASGAQQTLREVDAGNSLEKIQAILPKLKAADLSHADLIDGITEAYCPIAMADARIPKEQ